MKPLQKTSSWKSRSPLFLPLYLLLLITLALPAHAVARCFGAPEAEEVGEEASWSMVIEVTSSNGLVDSATLGVDPGATDGYDYEFDVVEPLYLFVPLDPEPELTLYAYFHYPDNPQTSVGSSDNPEATAGLTTSVIGPMENMTWPLQVAYNPNEDVFIRMSWDLNRTRQLGGYSVELFTPFGEVLSMAEVPNYSFSAGPDVYDFVIRALAKSNVSSSEQLLIVGAISAYVGAVAILLLLRRLRKGRS